MRFLNLKVWCVCFCILVGKPLHGQSDSIPFVAGSVLPDGIYLTYSDFRFNRPVTKAQVIWPGDKSGLEFFSHLMEEKKIRINRASKTDTVASENVWGYAQNNFLYLNYNGEFYRVPVFGAISYVVAEEMITLPALPDSRYGSQAWNNTRRELREFLVSFYDGHLRDLTRTEALNMFKDNRLLYEEFKKLGRHKQKKELYRFIRRYNEAHPVYFLRDSFGKSAERSTFVFTYS
jgi:hypothetical protein